MKENKCYSKSVSLRVLCDATREKARTEIVAWKKKRFAKNFPV